MHTVEMFGPRSCKNDIFHSINVESTVLFCTFPREPGGRQLTQRITDALAHVANVEDHLYIQDARQQRSLNNQNTSTHANHQSRRRKITYAFILPVDRGTSSAKLSTWARSSPSTKCKMPVEAGLVAFGNSLSIRAREEPWRCSAWTIHPFPSNSSTMLSPTNPVDPVTNATRGCLFVAIQRDFDVCSLAPHNTRDLQNLQKERRRTKKNSHTKHGTQHELWSTRRRHKSECVPDFFFFNSAQPWLRQRVRE